VGQHNYARECAEVLIRWKYELHNKLRWALKRSWFINRWGIPGRTIASDFYLEQLNFWVKVSCTFISVYNFSFTPFESVFSLHREPASLSNILSVRLCLRRSHSRRHTHG
jgi:hypothetical protein